MPHLIQVKKRLFALIYLIVSGAILATIVIVLISSKTDPVVCANSNIHLGVVDPILSSTVQCRFVMSNTSSEDIKLVDIKKSCGCLVVRPSSNHIKPHETLPLDMEIHVSPEFGEKDVALAVLLQNEKRGIFTLPLTVRMMVVPSLYITPSALDFGDIKQDEEQERQFQVLTNKVYSSAEEIVIIPSATDCYVTQTKVFAKRQTGGIRAVLGSTLNVTLRYKAGKTIMSDHFNVSCYDKRDGHFIMRWTPEFGPVVKL